MSVAPRAVAAPLQRIQQNRARVAEIRERARRLFAGGATGVQVAAAISEGLDQFIRDLFEHAVSQLPAADQQLIGSQSAVIAVGGTGRGDLAPFSDVDLLFLFGPSAQRVFRVVVAEIVRDFWDAGLKLGHSIRSLYETLAIGRSDPQVATALVESRLLCGSQSLFDRFQRQVSRKIFRGRYRQFIASCIESREKEREQNGGAVQQLEPDVKKSLGGLRDLHLLRWIAYARYGIADFDALQLNGYLSRDEALTIVTAHEYLLRIRCDLHFHAGKPNDLLTRDEQLRITEERGIPETIGLRGVEQFMREYFRHSTAIVRIVQRFLVTHCRPPLQKRLMRSFLMHRVNGMFRAGNGVVEVLPRHRKTVLSRLDLILKLFCSAALYGYRVEPGLVEQIALEAPKLSRDITPVCSQYFMTMMGCVGQLGPTLRSLFDTGVLDIVIPAVSHARCLLQFNQYHHYTVDEHTFRTIESVEKFEQDNGPIGAAYRSIRNKSVLHLALLLHDLGKGFEEDHSEVGRVIALRTAERLRLSDHDRELLVFLVHQHLKLATVALRRDLDDPALLLQLSQEVGSPETLKMLYVLTAADISGVGPGVLTSWKAELLTNLFDRVMEILGGQRQAHAAQERLQRIVDQVKYEFAPMGADPDSVELRQWIRDQLSTLPAHYLTSLPPERIITDLQKVRRLDPQDVVVEANYEPETESVEYRVIANSEVSQGCFYKIAGTLTAKRMEILSAQISTTTHGVVLDAFRVIDRDFQGEVPAERLDDVAAAIRSVLTGHVDPETLFRRSRRFGAERKSEPISNLPMKVVIDNESNDRNTIVDVFAHDRTGLLYTITRGLFDLGLSVTLAKISTHFDQVVDVFYVTDAAGGRINDEGRLRLIREELTSRISAFEAEGWQRFVS